MNKHLLVAGGLVLCAAVTSPACAEAADDGWRVSATIYLWAPAYDNEVTDKATGDTSGSSASFGDIIENLSGGFIGKAEVGKGRLGAFADVLYLGRSTDRTTNRTLLGPIETESEMDLITATVAGFYRVVRTDDLDVDLVGGFRYVDVEIELDVQGGGPGLTESATVSATEPVIGVRATQAVGPRSSMTGYIDYGGSGDLTVWQLIGTYNYQWKPNLAVFGGYRHFALEIDNSRVSSDVSVSGPVLGLTYRF